MLVIIDNGHGVDSPPGKCSPDGRLLEYRYCREIASRLSRELTLRGIETRLLVPGPNDEPLRERVRKVNAWARRLGRQNVLLVSLHNNGAAADGKWHQARGFSVFVSTNASVQSKLLAQMFTTKAEELGLLGNRFVPHEKYWVQSLAMTRDTLCPAVLTENLFQDNRDDVDFLLSEQGKATIVQLHVDAILQFITHHS